MTRRKMPATPRLFLALWPGPATLRTLAACQARWVWPPGAAVAAPERLHVTLHYIGPVAPPRVPEVTQGLMLPFQSFALTFDQPELWPRGLAVLCTNTTPEPLRALHADLRSALQHLQPPVESRPFRPHITLARHAAGAVPPAETSVLRWSVSGYALVQSQGGYRTLRHYR